MKKKAILLVAALSALTFALVGCGREEAAANTTLRIGATPTPHAEILEQVKPLLEEKGVTLEITVFTDFVQPNLALDGGDLDANFFQHVPYMNSFNTERGTNIVAVDQVHYEPMGLYPGRSDSLEDIQDGAIIAIPNDVTNGARALLLLESAGLITLDPNAGVAATVRDITENEKNLDIVEMEAALIPRALPDVDFAVLNGNFALQADLSVANDALVYEDPNSLAAETYANVIAVNAGNEQNEAILKLIEVIHSVEIRDFIFNQYQGAVLPMF